MSLQCSLWMIDCWSVHKSEEFRGWMRTHHPNIILSFVPENLTSLAQPLDIRIQQVLKQSMKCSAHKDIINETSGYLQSGTAPATFKLNTTLGTLHDQAVGWMVKAYEDINHKDLILKVSIYYCHYCLWAQLLPRCFKVVVPETTICLMNPSHPHPLSQLFDHYLTPAWLSMLSSLCDLPPTFPLMMNSVHSQMMSLLKSQRGVMSQLTSCDQS